MDLILWRHAEAEDGVQDSARQLTKRGRKQAAQIADWLKERLPEGCAILVSPAIRARQTADTLGLAYETSAAIGTDASVAGVLAATGWPSGKRNFLVVGHQPTLGRVAAAILTANEANWPIKKGAIWWLSSRARHGGEATLRAVIGPDLV